MTAKAEGRSVLRPYEGRDSGEVDFGFGLDDEEGFGIAAAGGAELRPGVFQGSGQDRKDDFAGKVAAM